MPTPLLAIPREWSVDVDVGRLKGGGRGAAVPYVAYCVRIVCGWLGMCCWGESWCAVGGRDMAGTGAMDEDCIVISWGSAVKLGVPVRGSFGYESPPIVDGGYEPEAGDCAIATVPGAFHVVE